jgi:hypothetical protein
MFQTQKKEVSRRLRKHTKEEMREKHRKLNGVYRKKKIDGFNLLRKCVPGTKKLFHLDILMSAVKYIKELENKIKELEKESPMESTWQTPKGMERDCTDSDQREPLMPQSSPTDLGTGLSSLMEAYISEPNSPAELSEMAEPTVKTFAITPTAASEEKSSRETSSPMDDHSAILKSLRNKILDTPAGASEDWRETSSTMDVTLQTTSEEIPEWIIVSPEEEEVPEFNSIEDLRQWLGL